MTAATANRAQLRGRLIAICLGAVLLAGLTWGWTTFRPQAIPPAPALESLGGEVSEGAYLATVGNCAACHTRAGGEPYAGGVRFQTPFGVLYSTNITPDAATGIGSWSFAEFHRAMKHGVDRDGANLYPAFPYTFFARMEDRDIASIFLYLRTLTPQTSPPRRNKMSFPFGERRLLYFWKRLHSGGAVGDAQHDRGAYLVEAVAHCGACHTPRNAIGGLRSSQNLMGGVYTDHVANGAYRTWSPPNITSGERGIANWTTKDIRDYLLEGANRHAVVHGPMAEVFNATRLLRPDDAQAIAEYLKRESGARRWSGLSLPRWGSSRGEVVYTVHCGTCHLADGGGDSTLGVSLRQNPIVQADDPASLINVVLYGPQLPPAPFSVSRTRMKPFGRRLSDADIAALATYLRSNFGNDASAVSPEQVRRQR